MQSIAGFPFLPLEFTKDGLPDAAQKRALLDAARGDLAGVTDLFVMSHGWNNDMGEARALYQLLLTNMRRRLDGGHPAGAGGRRFAVVGIYWPSKKFADAALKPDANPDGVAMSFDDGGIPTDILRAALDQLGSLLDLRDDPRLGEAKAAADEVGSGAGAERRFVDALRALLPETSDSLDDRSDVFWAADASDLLTALEAPVRLPAPPPSDDGGAAAFDMAAAGDSDGGAAGLLGSLAGRAAGALRLLNYATYYVMKERAGVVGRGLNAVLGELRAARADLKIHLVGHSFGARLVTAAVDGPKALRPSSLSLLQGAFSQNAFAEQVEDRTGFFRGVLRDHKVAGPIIATHTQNDLAVGIAYAIASRLSNDVAAGFGGPDDVYGGLGRNGAMRLTAAEHRMADLGAPDSAYPGFDPGVVVNLKADPYISGHGDVANPAVANAVLSAAR
jgi:hypothetical protein